MRKIWIYGKNHDDAQITLDLSDSGPVFGALDDMMMKMMEDDEKVRTIIITKLIILLIIILFIVLIIMLIIKYITNISLKNLIFFYKKIIYF